MKNLQDYAKMQKDWYETNAHLMNEGIGKNHAFHNSNGDYWNVLLKPIQDNKNKLMGKKALDFGCGQGRNIANMLLFNVFHKVDGIDISKKNLEYATQNLLESFSQDKFSLFENNGIDMANLASEDYGFVMSTIVFQHICCHSIRFGLMKEIYRVLEKGGILSFQMGFGEGHPKTAGYFDDEVNATSTNSNHDVKISDPNHLVNDLKKIGFQGITFEIKNSFSDTHHNWIYVVCQK